MGEWCRDILLMTAEGEKTSLTEQILLSEVLALRTLLLNALFAIASGTTLTEEDMTKLIEAGGPGEKLPKALALLVIADHRRLVGPHAALDRASVGRR